MVWYLNNKTEVLLMDDEMIDLYAFINVSSYRLKTLKALELGEKNPTQISKTTGIRVTHTSNVLRLFKDLGIAVCINEEKRKNRIYRLTNLGYEIAKLVDDEKK